MRALVAGIRPTPAGRRILENFLADARGADLTRAPHEP